MVGQHGTSQQVSTRQMQQQQQQKATRSGPGSRIATIAKLGSLALLAGAALMGFKRTLTDPALIQTLLEGAHTNPTTIIPLFMTANVIAPMALIPAAPFLLLAGAIWGVSTGLAISGTATLVSNLLMFVLGRNLLRRPISSYITANIPSFPSIQAAIVAEGWWLVLMLRFAPILPDSVMNYLLSITDISAGVYAATTAAATLAWSLLYLYLGSSSKDIIATLTGSSSKGNQSDPPSAEGGAWQSYTITGLSVVAGIGVLAYMFRVINKAIAKASAEQAQASCGNLAGAKQE